MGEHEQDTAPYPVTADRPVELHNPVRRARIAVGMLVFAIMAAATAGGWAGYELGARHTDARVSALERDQQQRAATRTQQIEQLRTTACVVLDRLPPDPDVDRQRQLFRCGPYVPQPSAAPAGPGATPRPGSTGGAPPAPPAQSGAPPIPHPPRPVPIPQPPPVPSPTPGSGLRVCLPILGCVL